ncbi:MSH2 protein [Dispira simplex]|nr:MSH2 protein [Dispira simplex]
MSSTNKAGPSLDLDQKTEQGFCAFFENMSEKPAGTLCLFERSNGEFYSAHGDDAQHVARHVYKTTSVLKYLGGDATSGGLPSCTMSRLVTENFLRDALLVHQLRIEIWVPESKKGAGSSLSNYNWKLGRRASPGNLQELEDLLFANSDMAVVPMVAAVQLTLEKDQKIIGVAYADTTQRCLGMAEFIDNDLFSNFESLVIQLGIKECIVPMKDNVKGYDIQKLHAVLARCNIVATECRRADFNPKDIVQDLDRLLEGEASVVTQPEYDLSRALGSTAALIRYLALLGDDSNHGHYRLRKYDLSQYMKLDASALRALNLMPHAQLGTNKTMSVSGLLDKCKTAQGSRLLNQWLKQPLMDLDAIRERQDLVQRFIDDTEVLQRLYNEYLRTVPDLGRLAKKFQRGKAHLQDVVRVYQVVVKLPLFVTALEEMQDPTGAVAKYYRDPLREHVENLDKLRELVETMVDLERVDHHEYLLRADFEPTLGQLQQQMDEAQQRMVTEQHTVSEDLDLEVEKRLKLEKSSLFGYCFRVTRIGAACIRNKPKQYIELSVQKSGVMFTTPTLRQLVNEYNETSEEYHRVQSALVKEVLEIVASYCSVLEALNATLAHLDVILSFALTSVQAPIPYVRPTVTQGGDLDLVGARHPCLEVQDDVSFIPNDVRLTRKEVEFQVITGPNMSGKSTYIRQIGVIVLLAQVGCFVPCSEASVCLFDSILARVGAGDNQLRGISTFMAEMLETSAILKSASPQSLIIIDELGRGTSTHDGFGLAWAISEYIIKHIGCFCLFATHFHELTALTEEFPQVGNLHVMAHVSEVDGRREITLLYKVKPGVCDQSFGIHVAELANFPSSVVKLARKKAEELENFTTDTSGNSAPVHNGNSFTPEQESQGQALIQEFMSEFQRVAHGDQNTPVDVQPVLRELCAKYQDRINANPYVQYVLQTY